MLRTCRRAEGTSTNVGSKCEVTFEIQAKNGSKSFEIRRRSHYRKHTLLRPQNCLSESPKSSFGCSKSPAGASKIDPVTVQNRTEVLKSAHDRPKIAPRVSRKRPKSSEERPRAPQELSKSDPRSPKWTPRALSRRPGELLETILRHPNSKNAPLLGQLLCDLRQSYDGNDFPSIFHPCA